MRHIVIFQAEILMFGVYTSACTAYFVTAGQVNSPLVRLQTWNLLCITDQALSDIIIDNIFNVV